MFCFTLFFWFWLSTSCMPAGMAYEGGRIFFKPPSYHQVSGGVCWISRRKSIFFALISGSGLVGISLSSLSCVARERKCISEPPSTLSRGPGAPRFEWISGFKKCIWRPWTRFAFCQRIEGWRHETCCWFCCCCCCWQMTVAASIHCVRDWVLVCSHHYKYCGPPSSSMSIPNESL